MAKILLGWEFGSGFGHVGKLILLARALKELGHAPVLALSQPQATKPIWEGRGIDVIAAPRLRPRQRPQGGPLQATLADIFVDAGLDNAQTISALHRAWNTLVARVKPDLVLCEYAPMLAMSTLGRIPTITIGTGFSTPPVGLEFQRLRFWTPGELTDENRQKETAMLAAINTAARQFGEAEFAHASDLFGGQEVFVCCLPELDCYAKFRATPAIGPLGKLAAPARSAAPEGIFAYLAKDPDLSYWLAGLAKSGTPAEAFIRDFDPASEEHPANVLVHARPVDLEATLSKRALLFHHGGMSTADTALRLGIPQVIVPRYLEQKVTAALLLDLGVALAFIPVQYRRPNLLPRALGGTAADTKMRAAATTLSAAIAARQDRPALDIVVEACGKYI